MAKRSAPRISAITFYRHQFKKSLQLIAKTGGDPVDAYAKLKKQFSAANLRTSKSAGLFILSAAAFIASSNTGHLKINTSLVSFSIPSVYLLFTSALLWSSFCINILSALQIVTFLNVFKAFFGRFRFNYEMLIFLKDGDLDNFIAPPYYDDFLAPSRTAFATRSALFLFLILALLLPVTAGIWTVASHSLTTALSDGTAPLQKSLAAASLVLIITSTLYLISAFIPFKSKRQTHIIR